MAKASLGAGPTGSNRVDLSAPHLVRYWIGELGCQVALSLASDEGRLRAADVDELKIAAVLLARALDQAERVAASSTAVRSETVQRLEAAGQVDLRII